MAISFTQAGASQTAIGARSSLASTREKMLAAAAKSNLTVQIDISSQDSTEESAKVVENEFRKLDIVLINSDVIGSMKQIIDSNPDDWWKVWEVNVKGPYLISRAFLPLMLKGGEKTIITLSSVGAHLTTPGLSDYQSTKLAVL
jgi:NAD(P)-dependent dehydrogenase (short-subunit alcohol dehydrogenase family)